MRPTQEEINAMVAVYCKASEKDRQFILAFTNACAEKNSPSRPELTLVVGGRALTGPDTA